MWFLSYLSLLRQIFWKLIKKSHITSRKTIYGLPIIAYTIQLRRRIPLSQYFQEVVTVNRYVLKLVHNDIIILNRVCSTTYLCGLKNRIGKINLVAIAQCTFITFIYRLKYVLDNKNAPLITCILCLLQNLSN